MKTILIKIIKSYQIILPPFLGDRCRFWPNCSQYFCQSIEKYGSIKGLFKGMARIIKCNPYHEGGVDQP